MKNNLLRLFFFLALIFVGLSGPLWLFAVGAVAYIFMYLGLEVIILAATIDAYFGYADSGWFTYTIAVSVVLFIAQWVRPHLSLYNQS